jgi:ribosome-associated protein
MPSKNRPPVREVSPSDPVGGAPTRPSKTARKHAMHDLQALGVALIALEPRRLAELELPERLADAIGAARRITAHEGRRRQIQYVGRLMREVDPAPIREALDRLEQVPREQKARFAAVEAWRTRLVDDPAALDLFLAQYPDADRAALVRAVDLVRNAAGSGHAPRPGRELFRLLRKVVDAA